MDPSFQQTLIDGFDDPTVLPWCSWDATHTTRRIQYSDVDLARFTSASGDGESQEFRGLIADQLVVVNNLGPTAVDDIFTKPEIASSYLAGTD